MDRPIKQFRPATHTELFLRAKQAQGPLLANWPPAVRQGTPRSSNQHAQAKRDALLQLLQIGAIGLGGGVAGRSALGLAQLFNPPDVDVTTSGPVRPEVHVPLAGDRKEKFAGSKTGPPGDMFQYFANMLPDISTDKVLGDWWGPTAALGAGGVALGGGYGLTNWLLKKEQEKHRDSELDSAAGSYQRALADEYRAAMLAKQAGDDLGIDDLYDAITLQEKQADFETAQRLIETPYRAIGGHNAVQETKGWLLAAMAATGLGSGYAMYNHTRGKNKQKLLNQALAARARRRAMMSPAPPLAIMPLREEGY